MQESAMIRQQLVTAGRQFQQRFGRPARFAAIAPGRVNLIGEHTDYNDGFVMPMAIQRQTVILADRAVDEGDAGGAATCRFVASDLLDQPDAEAVFQLDPDMAPGQPDWANYVRGVFKALLDRGLNPGSIDALVHSTVPLGGGLSSSAALEVAAATLIETITQKPLDPVDKALACQWAEHHFAGVPVGIMDQFISTLGQADHAMLLDCRSMQRQMVPLRDPDVAVLIVNSHVAHELAEGEYAARREQCEQAAAVLGVDSLRDATRDALEAARGSMDPLLYRRARHVITENQRTVEAAQLLQAGQWQAVGRLMVQSHASLRDDYQVSCPELDLLVELATDAILADDVHGSRMTGGGFGGCTVTLVASQAAERVMAHIASGYHQRTGIEPLAFVTRPAAGARGMLLN